MKLLLAVLSVIAFAAAEDSCPAFGQWLPWSSTCTWMANDDGKVSLKPIHKAFVDACAIEGLDVNQFTDPPVFSETTFPARCGYCSAKIRCQKAPLTANCFPFNFEHQVCEDHNAVCDMPMVPTMNNCRWNLAMEMVKQCMSRADIPDWKRKAMIKFGNIAPETNCIEKDGRCKCCCHPYQPSEDGSTCEKVPDPPECAEFGEYNDWSECLWYPMEDMKKKFQDHCALEAPADIKPPEASPVPDGMTIPEKCGFCSFKVSCRKRDAQGKHQCFPVEAMKKACGPDDCPTCGNVCSMGLLPENEKMKTTDGAADRCYYPQMLMQRVESQAKPVIGQIKSYWRKRGMLHLLKNIPLGKCVQKGDACKCCCHPYEPSEDGTQCVVKPYCKTPEDLGMQIKINA